MKLVTLMELDKANIINHKFFFINSFNKVTFTQNLDIFKLGIIDISKQVYIIIFESQGILNIHPYIFRIKVVNTRIYYSLRTNLRKKPMVIISCTMFMAFLLNNLRNDFKQVQHNSNY